MWQTLNPGTIIQNRYFIVHLAQFERGRMVSALVALSGRQEPENG